MKSTAVEVLTIIGLFLAAVPGNAHHSFASVFDREDPISLTGTVTKVEWMNPHTLEAAGKPRDVEADGTHLDTRGGIAIWQDDGAEDPAARLLCVGDRR